MSYAKNLTEDIINKAIRSSHYKIEGQDNLIRGISRFLCEEMHYDFDLFLLCSKKGLILDFIGKDTDYDIIGHTIPLSYFRSQKEYLLFEEEDAGFAIVTENKQTLVSSVIRLQKQICALYQLYDSMEDKSAALLHCFNSVKKAISIYDKDTRLLFGNENFFRNFNVTNPDMAIGKTINEIMTMTGTRAQSIGSNTTRMKMFDVLETGKEALDWEVRMENKNNPGQGEIVSNDMYPIKGDNNEVKGMIEISRSRQQDIKRTRKIVGLAAEYTFDDIIGSSAIMREKVQIAKDFANSQFNFLITGESGVGKELFAQSIHNYSPYKNGPFVALNCANFSEGLIESELFGYVGGAFTGASKNGQIGKFELADGGTLFLDEIGELPYNFQSKLLRVLENRTVTRIGSTKQIPVNVRVIAATNRNLEKMVEEGLFREDLYYRLQVLAIEIPPLRDRRDDLILLADTFLRQAMNPLDSLPKKLDRKAQHFLMEYDWPGNVRELRNVLNRATVLAKGDVISRETLEASIYSKSFQLTVSSAKHESPEVRLQKRQDSVNQAYAELIREALDITGGNKKKAAELLDISRNTLYRMMEKYELM